jgi:TetR/AcrR family transcriptional repressor of nem operon
MMIVMRYEKGRKAITRQKILETAATEFRKRGFEGVGVADLMARAGLTHGGFFSHFESKEELVQESIQFSFGQNDLSRFGSEEKGWEKMVRHYLRPDHRDHPETGCPIASLVGEAPRRAAGTRARFSARMDAMIATFEAALPREIAGEARRAAALAVTAVVLGALQMARAAANPELSNQILAAGIKAALDLARP